MIYYHIIKKRYIGSFNLLAAQLAMSEIGAVLAIQWLLSEYGKSRIAANCDYRGTYKKDPRDFRLR